MMTTFAVDEHNGVPGSIINIVDKTGTEIVIFVPNDVEAWGRLENICNNIIDIAYDAMRSLQENDDNSPER